MSETASSSGGAAPGPALRVLVVDDHRLFRGGLRDVLEESGIAIAGEADSGEEALELAPALSPDASSASARPAQAAIREGSAASARS